MASPISRALASPVGRAACRFLIRCLEPSGKERITERVVRRGGKEYTIVKVNQAAADRIGRENFERMVRKYVRYPKRGELSLPAVESSTSVKTHSTFHNARRNP